MSDTDFEIDSECGPKQDYPLSPLERFQWLEEKCGCKREWFQKLLDLEGFGNVMKSSFEEIIDEYSAEAFRWECACRGVIGRDLDLFISYSDDKKKELIADYLKHWISQQLFKKWNW
jgi:hypothetical protein